MKDHNFTNLEIADALKNSMRRMPSPVAIVSTVRGQDNEPCGMAVTAFGPVSMEPPSMQISINRNASAYQSFLETKDFCINVLNDSDAEQLENFSNSCRKSERFNSAAWFFRGHIPYLSGARSSIFCKLVQQADFGTHSIFIGAVYDVLNCFSASPLIWMDGGARALNGVSD